MDSNFSDLSADLSSDLSLFHIILAFLGGVMINILTEQFNKYRTEKNKKEVFNTLAIIEIDEFLDNAKKILDTFNAEGSIYLSPLQRLHLIRDNLNLLSQIHFLSRSRVKPFLNYYIESANLIENMENNERVIFDIKNSINSDDMKKKLLDPKFKMRKDYIEELYNLRAAALKLREHL